MYYYYQFCNFFELKEFCLVIKFPSIITFEVIGINTFRYFEVLYCSCQEFLISS